MTGKLQGPCEIRKMTETRGEVKIVKGETINE